MANNGGCHHLNGSFFTILTVHHTEASLLAKPFNAFSLSSWKLPTSVREAPENIIRDDLGAFEALRKQCLELQARPFWILLTWFQVKWIKLWCRVLYRNLSLWNYKLLFLHEVLYFLKPRLLKVWVRLNARVSWRLCIRVLMVLEKVESRTYEEFIKSYEWMTRHLMNNSMVLASIERFLSMDPRSTARHSKQSFLGANGTGAVKRQVDRTLSWKEWLLNRPDTRLILLLCKRPRERSKNFPNNQAKLQSHACNKTC